MNKETIEKTAREYAEENPWYPGETSYESDIREMEEKFADAYIAGADWRINSVWHGMNEKPSEMFAILAEFGEEEYSLGITLDGMESAKRWAYVADLLPDRKEATL